MLERYLHSWTLPIFLDTAHLLGTLSLNAAYPRTYFIFSNTTASSRCLKFERYFIFLIHRPRVLPTLSKAEYPRTYFTFLNAAYSRNYIILSNPTHPRVLYHRPERCIIFKRCLLERCLILSNTTSFSRTLSQLNSLLHPLPKPILPSAACPLDTSPSNAASRSSSSPELPNLPEFDKDDMIYRRVGECER